MKKYITFLITALLLMALSSCHQIEEYPNNSNGNFEQLWKLFDEHYCFFAEKGVDWQAVHDEYAPQAANCYTSRQLFDVCSRMVGELRDGHVNLSAWFNTYYYREWWTDYPQNFNKRVIQENYLYFNYSQLGDITFAILPQNVGYMRVPSFDSGIGEGNLDAILNAFNVCDGIIIDVRDNGGGSMTNAETIARRFITERTLAGYIRHKDGPGHDDFSDPYAFHYAPPENRRVWTKPVVVLANRSTFSAANIFVAFMKNRPQVTVMGAVTGGGGGMPLSFELPIGWGVRMSAAPVLDENGMCTENGIEPTEGYAMDITDADMLAGRDTILDAAIALLTHNR